ncbi:hypothetical protein QOZ80_2AG0114730 [Eleusine coracana subsp. coracana]|nr:hypothetical protein QOZ80_2AG0114730 [Eleusine coracana subsp. coracana]
MKRRRAPRDSGEERDEPRLHDDLVAAEILSRLPARAAARCAALSRAFRGLLQRPGFWLRPQRLGAPTPGPHAACFIPYTDGAARLHHAFHFLGPTFSVKHAVASCSNSKNNVAYQCVGTCNGLVLLSEQAWTDGSRVKGVVVNPATKEEETILLTLPDGRGETVGRCFCGFAYSPLARGYNKLARTVFSSCRTVWSGFPSSMYLEGKVYILANIWTVMAFDVDDETVVPIASPPGGRVWSRLMEIWGRPCIATWDGKAATLWALTADHRWERRCTLAEAADLRTDVRCVLIHTYDLQEPAQNEWHLYRPAASSWRNGVRQPEEAKHLKLQVGTHLWGYQPTLVSPSNIFGHGTAPIAGCSLTHFRSGRCRRPGNTAAEQRLYLEAYVPIMWNLAKGKKEFDPKVIH